MKILIVAATIGEIYPFLKKFNVGAMDTGVSVSAQASDIDLNFLITGVGMVNTTYFLSREINRSRPDLCINAGVAGSFKKEYPIGSIVRVEKDVFGDLGAEDGEEFLSLSDLGLGENDVLDLQGSSYSNGKLNALPLVKAISVNKVHGYEKSIAKVAAKFSPDIESMEGAAFMFTCINERLKHVQLRSVSNFVERRNRDKWNLPLAIKNLNDFLIELIPTLK
jgi:futalosine hydrolase